MGMLNVVKQSIEKGREKIKAYHGSPHDFDKFSTDNIGTGEGAQAYGRGLYFAERKGTAESYRDSLTARDAEYEDWLTRNYKDAESSQDYSRMEMYERAMMHDKPKDFRDLAKDTDYDEDYRALANEVAEEIDSFTKADGTKPNFGKMYEVEIDASPDDLLDFDAPLDEQPQNVKNLLNKTDWNEYAEDAIYERMYDSNPTGSSLLRYLEEEGSGYASEALKDAGIKGVKYADAQTRFSPKGKTHNYVIFDDKLIDISRKYGIPPAMASAVLAGTMSPEQAQAQTESTARQDMTRRERRANPPSEVLRNYSVGQAGKAIGEMGLGVVQGLGEGLDFFNSANVQRSVMGLPQLTPAQDALSPITDIRLLEDGEGRDNARTIGSLFSPI